MALFIWPNLALPVGHLLVNAKAFNSLSKDLQNIFAWSAERYGRIVASEYAAAERLQESTMNQEAIIRLPAGDLAKMRKIAIETWDLSGIC